MVGTLTAKFLYSAAMSLDRFIAGPGGDVSWMTDYLGPNPVVDELTAQTGAILVGNRTFGGDDPHKGQEGEGEVFGGGWTGPQFVLTHRSPAEQRPWVTVVGDIDTAIKESGAWCLSCRCCSATAPACSHTPAEKRCGSSRSASRIHLR